MSIFRNLGIEDINEIDPDMIKIRKYYPGATLESDGVMIDFNKNPLVITFPENDPLCARVGGTDKSPMYGFRDDMKIILSNPITIMLDHIDKLEHFPKIVQSKTFIKNGHKTNLRLMTEIEKSELKYIPDIIYNCVHIWCPGMDSLSELPRHIHNLELKNPGIQNLLGCPDVQILILNEAEKLSSLADIPSSVGMLSLKSPKHYNDLLCSMTEIPPQIIINSDLSQFINKHTLKNLYNRKIGHNVILEIRNLYRTDHMPREVLELGGDYRTDDGYYFRVVIYS